MTMARPMQFFVAPGDPDEPMPGPCRPWTDNRDVVLPLADWGLILDYAKGADSEWGTLLAVASGGPGPDEPVKRAVPAHLLIRLIEFVEHLAVAFDIGVDVTEEQAARGLGDYGTEAYAKMLRAVAEVLRESARTGERFDAWQE